jgi:hypothetical protein
MRFLFLFLLPLSEAVHEVPIAGGSELSVNTFIESTCSVDILDIFCSLQKCITDAFSLLGASPYFLQSSFLVFD